MSKTTVWMILLILVPALRVRTQDKPKAPPAPTTAEKFADARAKAEAKNRRVLCAFLGDDDLSDDFAESLRRNRKLARLLLYEFVVLKLDAVADRDFAAARGIDLENLGVPAVAVFDSTGKVIAKLNKNAFWSEQHGLEPGTFADTLTGLQVEPLDAEEQLASALAVCEKSDRRLLLHFDAPW